MTPTPVNKAELDFERLAARCSEQPNSPLFARLADLHLARHRAADALALCERGVKIFPAYAAGHLVLGKCYRELGRVAEARAAFRRAFDLAPYNTVLQSLLIGLPEEEVRDLAVDPPVLSRGESEPTPKAAVAEPAAVAPAEEADTLPAMEVTPTGSAISAEPVPDPVPEVKESTDQGAGGDLQMSVVVNEDDRDESNEPVTDLFTAQAEPALADQAAEPEAPDFEPFPTFEEYIRQHPEPTPVMTLEEYLKGRKSAADSASLPGDAVNAPAAESIPEPGASFPVPSDAPESTDLESLAFKLQNAKRIIPADLPPTPTLTGAETDADISSVTIITPTMAEIYVAQEEFQAAIDAYEKLKIIQPELSSAFQRRIDAIRLLLRTDE